MKILYVITSSDVGGAERALTDLLSLVAQQNTARVVCLKPLGAEAKQWQKLGADVVSLNMTGAGLGCVSKLVAQLEAFQPDLVHAMLFRAMEFARLACAGRNIPLITTPHFDFSKKSVWARTLDRLLCRLDTVSVAESLSTYEQLCQVLRYPPSKTRLIGNSVKKSLFFNDNSIRARMRQTYGFTERDVLFMSVARLASVKNPQGLLRAFSQIVPRCPQAKLIYVGGGTEYHPLKKMIAEFSLEGKVILAGEQSNVTDWLNMADVFVLVSHEESLPLALLEAQQVGLPCIVSKAGDMPKQVIHGQNGFVCNGKDEMLLACLLTELYENADLRRQMGEKSLQKMTQEPDSSQQYQQLYQQVVGR